MPPYKQQCKLATVRKIIKSGRYRNASKMACECETLKILFKDESQVTRQFLKNLTPKLVNLRPSKCYLLLPKGWNVWKKFMKDFWKKIKVSCNSVTQIWIFQFLNMPPERFFLITFLIHFLGIYLNSLWAASAPKISK